MRPCSRPCRYSGLDRFTNPDAKTVGGDRGPKVDSGTGVVVDVSVCVDDVDEVIEVTV